MDIKKLVRQSKAYKCPEELNYFVHSLVAASKQTDHVPNLYSLPIEAEASLSVVG